MEEKVESVRIAFQQINIAEAARQADIPESSLRYDLNKLERALPTVLANQKPGPPPRPRPALLRLSQSKRPNLALVPSVGVKSGRMVPIGG